MRARDRDMTIEARLRSTVRALTALGDRRSAGPNERRAGTYLSERLREAGVEVATERFRGSGSGGARVLVHLAIAAAGLVVRSSSPWPAATLTALALASFVAEQMTFGPWLSRVVCTAPSHNVC